MVQLTLLQAGNQFGRFLHNGQVGGEVGVKHIVEAQCPQGGGHPVDGGQLPGQAQRLAPGRPHGGGDLHHSDLLRVGQRVEGLLGVVPLPQGAHGAVGDALAAEGTLGVLDDPVVGDVDGGASAGAGQVPDVQALHLVADLDAAHTFNALLGVPIQGEGGGPGGPLAGGQLGFVGHRENAQVVGDGLQAAVAAAHAGGALAVVLGEDQLHVHPAGAAGAGRIGMHHHALPHRVVAGGDHGVFALHLHTAHPAGGDFVDAF